jgi:SH3 domain protein
MKTLSMMLLVISEFLGIAQQGWAPKAYVTDSFEPHSARALATRIKSLLCSFPVARFRCWIHGGEWSQVKVLDDGKEGWVMSRYLVTRLPWEVQARRLQEDSVSLNAKLNRLQKEFVDESQQRQGLAEELKRKTEAVEVLSMEHLELNKGAGGYLRLKTIHEATEKDLKAAQAELSKLSAENETLRSSQQNRWFLSGALVLLCGLLIGGIAGRQQRKRRSLYS